MESVPSLPDVILGASVYKSGDTSYIYVEQQDAALVFILLVLLLLSDSWNFSSLTSDNECIPELERTRECSP